MNRILSGRFFWPMTECLCGRDTMRRLRQLRRSGRATADELRALQNARLRRLLRMAEEHCPFYRRRFQQVGFDVHDPRITVDDLRRLPTLSRDEIHESLDELTWSSPQPAPYGPPVLHHTGGSSGEPLKFHIDRARQAADWAARWRARGWWGVRPGDREILLWGAPIHTHGRQRLRRWRDRLLNQVVLSAFEMTDDRLETYVKQMIRFRPVCIYGYATSLATLARHVLRRPGTERLSAMRQLRAVFVTGETLIEHDRQLIESAFGAPVVNEYGARDAGLLALQCPAGSLHIPSENVIVELLEPSRNSADPLSPGEPVSPGETGEVVVTYLENFVMPFIRYRVGDLARRPSMSDGTCPCGRAHPLLAEIQGRMTDQIVIRQDGQLKRMHALSLIYALREMDGIRRFRIVQSSLDAFTIELVADERFTTECEHRLTGRLRLRLGKHVTIHIQRCEAIRTGASGKHACVISHVA